MRRLPHLYWFVACVYVQRVSLSPVSITDQSPFDTCIWVILNLARLPILLVVILHGDILYATAGSVHHMGELLQPAAWQTLITAGEVLIRKNEKLNILRGRIATR